MTQAAMVGVIGAGTMGAGIAQVFAAAGSPVVLQDLSTAALDRARATIEKGLGRLVKKQALTQDAAADALGRIETTVDLEKMADRDIIIEAIVEKLEVKADLIGKLDGVCRADAVLASNTSSIPLTQLAAASAQPSRVIGMHFFNPVPVMKLVEVIKGLATSEATTAITMEFAKALGKTPIAANDRAGFVSNRVLMPMINEAFHAWMEGVASPEAVDEIMKLGCNFPMGPLRLADFIGLDVCHDIMMVLHRELGDPKYFPCPLLRQLVQAGRLGDKTGQGVYRHAGA